MNLTGKQNWIMQILTKGNQDGSFCDLDELLEQLGQEFDWHTTKQSLQFSIRALIKRKLIYKVGTEKRRGRNRVVLAPTFMGYQVMRG